MTRALLVLLLAAPEPDAAESELAALRALAAAPLPEPEPPPGLRAPPGTERFEREKARYAEEIARWEASEKARHRRIAEGCGAWLLHHPSAAGRAEALRLRGEARYHLAEFAAARADLEASLDLAPDARASGLCVAACRALGDFRGALRHAPDDPELLEEAGEVERAIRAALAAGRPGRAADWGRIGGPLPDSARDAAPAGFRALLVAPEGALDPGLRERLAREFPPPRLVLAAAAEGEKRVYLADQDGIVWAVNPRPDTWIHRIRRLTAPP